MPAPNHGSCSRRRTRRRRPRGKRASSKLKTTRSRSSRRRPRRHRRGFVEGAAAEVSVQGRGGPAAGATGPPCAAPASRRCLSQCPPRLAGGPGRAAARCSPPSGRSPSFPRRAPDTAPAPARWRRATRVLPSPPPRRRRTCRPSPAGAAPDAGPPVRGRRGARERPRQWRPSARPERAPRGRRGQRRRRARRGPGARRKDAAGLLAEAMATIATTRRSRANRVPRAATSSEGPTGAGDAAASRPPGPRSAKAWVPPPARSWSRWAPPRGRVADFAAGAGPRRRGASGWRRTAAPRGGEEGRTAPKCGRTLVASYAPF